MKIQLRFLLILSLVTVGSVIFMGFSIFHLVEDILEEKILNQMDATASVQKSRINEAIEKIFERLNGVTSRTQLRISLNDYLENGDGDYNLINKILIDSKNSINDFNSITIVDPNGMTIFSTDENQINHNYLESKIFLNAISSNHISFDMDKNLEKTFVVSGPLILDEKFLGVLMISLHPEFITDIVTDYTNLDETGETILAKKDENGDAQFITPSRFGAENFGPISKSDMNIPVTHALLMSEIQFTDIVDYRGKPVLSSTRYIEETDWGLVVKIDKSEAFESLELIQQYIVFITTVVGLLSVMCSFYFSNTLSSPIKKLKKATELLSAGNFESQVILSTGDELEDLANSFNKMIDSVKKSTDLDEQLAIQSTLKKALDESSDVSITDKNGIIKYVNDKFCDSSKYSKEEVIGKNHRIIKSGYHPSEFYKNMWATIISGNVWHDHIKNKAKDGTFYWDDMIIVPFLDKDKKIQEYIAIRRDITERINLNAEKLKNEKMITIGELSARMAHDIRNPLSIIRVSLENLKLQYGIDDIQNKSFDKVERSIDRIAHQIDDVLDFVRGHTPELDKTKFIDIVDESLDSIIVPDNVKLILPKNNVEFFADKKLFAVAINNLILNGIQAIDGVGTVEITCEENKEAIIIQVKDSGSGIPKENLDSIFEPLFTTKQHGTGLGLAGVRSIIESHGGIISVTSPPTIFTITLPKVSD